MLQRLKQTPAAKSDGYNLVGVKLKGDLATDGVVFTMPSAVPVSPKVLMTQRLFNCSSGEVTGKSSVNQSTENSETFSKATQLGGETAVSVSYQSPVGLGGSASQSFNYATTSTQEKTYTETANWDQGVDVSVGPRSAVMVQFVVSGQKLDDIPWATNVIVNGPAELTYEKPSGSATVCVHEDSVYSGKRKCWTTSSTRKVGNLKEEKWDRGGGNLNDEVSAITITGGAKVTVYQHTNFGGWSEEYSGNTPSVGKGRNDRISSLVIEPQGSRKTTTENLQKYVNDQQRRIALSGKYNGVNGVLGDFRTGNTTPLGDAECGPVGQAVAQKSAPQTAAGKSANSAIQSANKPQTGVQAVVVAPNASPLEGKILASGIKPTTRQVVKTSIKKT